MEPGIRSNGPASLQLARMVGIDKSVTEGLLEVKSVKTHKRSRRQGHASRLLDEVCKEADSAKMLLVLTPAQFDNGPIGTQQLQSWYERFGFAVIQDKPMLMCRDPKPAPLVVIKHVPEGRRYDIKTDTFSGPKVLVEVDGVEYKAQIAAGMDAKGWAERVVSEVIPAVNAQPAKHFANPPYSAELFNEKSGWAGVMNAQGVNCLTFPSKPGASVTDIKNAERIAAEWNSAVVSVR